MATVEHSASRRLPRVQRREHILAAATQAFARAGFEGTSLEDLAAAAGVSRAILYRHFSSKGELYRAVLDRVRARLQEAVGEPPYSGLIVDHLLGAAAADPDGFRLLFEHAAREPSVRQDVDHFNAAMRTTAHDHLSHAVEDPAWAEWAARLAPTTTIAAITAWLDAGRPDPDGAPDRIRHVLGAISAAAVAEPP